MSTIVYCSPLVPAEWLAAHRLQPVWWRPSRHGAGRANDTGDGEADPAALDLPVLGRRGVCPLAAAVADSLSASTAVSAAVLTTTCDQMRYVGSWLEHRQRLAVFVMNVPSTWQTESAQSLYLEELQRLGRFLVAQGGTRPSRERLVDVMLRFDAARTRLRQVRGSLSASQFAAALLAIREDPRQLEQSLAERPWIASAGDSQQAAPARGGIPLALIGGPLPEPDYELFEWVRQAGGRIVLDATEWGERTLPRRFDLRQVHGDPERELADAYFRSIPAIFRRPHDALYDYLGRELADRGVRGLLVRRYLWCDLWHAEVTPLKAWSPVPVLDLDAADSEASSAARSRGRIEAFLEMLR